MSAPTVRLVVDCRGAQWAIDPDTRTVWVLNGDPAAVGRRLAEALAVLANPRPQLRLILGGAA